MSNPVFWKNKKSSINPSSAELAQSGIGWTYIIVVDNIRFGSDTEVIQLLTHNAPLTLCILFTSKPETRYSTQYNKNNISSIGTPTYTEGVVLFAYTFCFRHTALLLIF